MTSKTKMTFGTHAKILSPCKCIGESVCTHEKNVRMLCVWWGVLCTTTLSLWVGDIADLERPTHLIASLHWCTSSRRWKRGTWSQRNCELARWACQYAHASCILLAKRCYFTFDFYTKLTSTAESSNNNKTYVLPDENIITVGAERIRFSEVLFQISFSAWEASGIHNNSFLSLTERHVSIYKCVRHVASGTCVFFEFVERMTEELTASAPFMCWQFTGIWKILWRSTCNHCTSTLRRYETNGIAESAVRRVKEGTSAVLLQSGLDEKWWADSAECHCYLLYVPDLLAEGKLRMKNDLENHSKGQ